MVKITPPGESEVNYTMNYLNGDIWQYKFTDYANGTYSYTVLVNDSTGLTDSDSGTFEMYIHLYSNIKTLKDNYSDNEFVNITDPPENAQLEELSNYLITEDTAWTVLKKDYITKYIDFDFIYINDSYYRINWKWSNRKVKEDFMDCSNTSPPFQTACAKFIHEKYFPEYNLGTLRSDLSYLKNHPLPKGIVKGNADIIGDINPFAEDKGRIYINLKDGFYKSNGLRIKLGFNTTIAEFNNTKETENLTFRARVAQEPFAVE